jgi:hypothetical protein
MADEPPRRRSRERGPARFKEGDIVKAIKAARKAKMEIAAVKIEPDGTILIIPGTPDPVVEPNPWDEPDDWGEPTPPRPASRRRRR